MIRFRWLLIALALVGANAYAVLCSVPGTVTGQYDQVNFVSSSAYNSGTVISTVSVADAGQKACAKFNSYPPIVTVTGTGTAQTTVTKNNFSGVWTTGGSAGHPGSCSVSYYYTSHTANGTTVDTGPIIQPQGNASVFFTAGATGTCPYSGACTAKLGTALTGEVSAPVSGKIVPFKICSDGCGYIPVGGSASGMGVWGVLAGKWTYSGPGGDWRGDGQACTSSPIGDNGTGAAPSPTPEPLPAGKCPGEVNGVAVVVSCDSTAANSGTAGSGSSASGLPTTQNSPTNIPGGTNTTTKSTVCENAICVTTTNTTNYGLDGKATNTPTYSTDDQGTFCSKNPGSPLCTGYSDGKPIGEGTGEPEEEEPTPECEEGNTTLGCASFGSAPTAEVLQKQTQAMSITADTGWTHDSSCPADRVVNSHFVTFSIPFTMLCNAADMARPIVIAVAWVSALFGFMGLSKRD